MTSPEGKDCSVPEHIDNKIGNTQLHMHGKQQSYLAVSLGKTQDKQGQMCKCHFTFTEEKMNVIKCTFHEIDVSPVPEYFDSSLKCMLSYLNHFKLLALQITRKLFPKYHLL